MFWRNHVLLSFLNDKKKGDFNEFLQQLIHLSTYNMWLSVIYTFISV